jgi:hypothetical protein
LPALRVMEWAAVKDAELLRSLRSDRSSHGHVAITTPGTLKGRPPLRRKGSTYGNLLQLTRHGLPFSWCTR